MAYTAKDGKRFANHQAGKYYDNVKDPVAADETKPEHGEPDGDEGGEEQPIESVVGEHGPAHTTHIEKKDGDSYSVHSEHDDGHKHSSHGHDVHSAHEHSKKAHGVEEEHETDGDEEPSEMPSVMEG